MLLLLYYLLIRCYILHIDSGAAPGSFLYSLRSAGGDIHPFKSSLKDENDPHAVSSFLDEGPSFGYRGIDFFIADLAGSNNRSFSKLGFTYETPPDVHTPFYPLAGSFNFTPSEIEVLYLN